MLNRQLSSSSSKRENEKKKKSPRRSPLRDLNGISGSHCSGSSCTRSTTTTSSSSSSSMSLEASRGCLRFFLPNASASRTPLRRPKPKTTPKSAPNRKASNPSSTSSSRSNKPLKENLAKPRSEKGKLKKNPPFLYQWQHGKKPSSKTVQKPYPSSGLGTSACLADNLASGSEQFTRKQCNVTVADEPGKHPEVLNLPDLSIAVENSTPVGKLQCGSGLGCEVDGKIVKEGSTTSPAVKTTTPPVQASVSPEILCGPSMLVSAATPACYGAGHIVSGVTDRRKCRAKGILTVGGESDSNFAKANIFDSSDDAGILSKPKASLVPSPAEASMHWLLSPRDEEDRDQNSGLENGLHCLQKSLGSTDMQCLSSPSSGRGILCNDFENSGSTTSTSRRRTTRINLLSPSGNPTYRGRLEASHVKVAGRSSSVSPYATPTCEALISQEKGKHRYDLAGENSPFSIGSLGSGNVIQTPESDLSSDRHVGLSWLNNSCYEQNHDLGSEIDSLEVVLLRASLSPKTQILDPPGLNFEISDLISSTNSIDLTKFPKTWDNRASCTSNSTLDDMSRSNMRISWREGLMSRMFEMDEFDCCRYLSDDENDMNECSDGKFQCSPKHELNIDEENVAVFSQDFGSSDVVGREPKSDTEKFPEQRSNPCAESICTDGGGLFASADSDWTFCYKNQLFES